VYKKNVKNIELWLLENKSQRYSEEIIKNLRELFKNTNINLTNIKNAIEETKYSKKYTIISFRVFLNYCELNDLLNLDDILKYRSKVKLNIKSKMDSFVPTKEQIQQSLKIIDSRHPAQLLILYRAMLESGLRFTELKHIILTFDERRVEIWENKIAVYSNFYIRGKKSSYFVFVSNPTYKKLVSILSTLTPQLLNMFQDKISKDKKIISLKYLRKYQFTLLIEKGVSLEIANFIQGRASQNVGFNHYLSKKAISLTEYNKILDDFY
jgi:intergrase/recombinase